VALARTLELALALARVHMTFKALITIYSMIIVVVVMMEDDTWCSGTGAVADLVIVTGTCIDAGTGTYGTRKLHKHLYTLRLCDDDSDVDDDAWCTGRGIGT